jgi:hypothetical protein
MPSAFFILIISSIFLKGYFFGFSSILKSAGTAPTALRSSS